MSDFLMYLTQLQQKRRIEQNSGQAVPPETLTDFAADEVEAPPAALLMEFFLKR